MPLDTTAPLPSLADQNYGLGAAIRMSLEGPVYMAYVKAQGSPYCRIATRLSRDEVANLNSRFRKEISAAILDRSAPDPLETLAAIGRYAYNQLFPEAQDKELIQSALELMGPTDAIETTGEEFALPWDLLYDGDMAGTLAYHRFWGMRYIIQRNLVVKQRRFAPVTITTARPRIGLLAHERLAYVAGREIPFFRGLDSAGKITLVRLDPLNPNERQKGLASFLKFWQQSLELAHVACHGHDDADRIRSSIEVALSFPITIQDMDIGGLQLATSPLVILNGCHTGDVDPGYVSSIVGKFLEAGARGAIATEGPVPDDLAAEFTEQLYTRLLAGGTLGESLMTARRYLLAQFNSPVGLLYALYAAPHFHFITPPAAAIEPVLNMSPD